MEEQQTRASVWLRRTSGEAVPGGVQTCLGAYGAGGGNAWRSSRHVPRWGSEEHRAKLCLAGYGHASGATELAGDEWKSNRHVPRWGSEEHRAKLSLTGCGHA